MKNKHDKKLLKAFEELEAVRHSVKAKRGIVPYLKEKNGHVWAEGYFEPLRPDFISSGSERSATDDQEKCSQ